MVKKKPASRIPAIYAGDRVEYTLCGRSTDSDRHWYMGTVIQVVSHDGVIAFYTVRREYASYGIQCDLKDTVIPRSGDTIALIRRGDGKNDRE